MLIQTTSPRPIVNASESPQHVRIHTLRKTRVSSGEVLFIIGEKQLEVEPFMVYPIEGETQFEALEYYLPFWKVFGTNKPVYDESRIRQNIENQQFHRVNVSPMKKLAKRLIGKSENSDSLTEKLTGVQLALIGSTGYHVIVKSAHRTEGSTYEERIVNFTILCPVNGGGIIRIANCPIDVANPTFDPYAPLPQRTKDLTLLQAFNRTHRPRTDAIEETRRKRIEEAEATMRANERGLPGRIDD